MNLLPMVARRLSLPLVLLLATGCDKISGVIEDPGKAVQEQVKSVQDTASQALETVQETVGGSGSAELTLDKPLAAAACYATLVQPGSGRTAILEIKNYRTAEEETFPSYLFHAAAPGSSWSELANQTLSGQLYVRFTPDGPIWFSGHEQPVQVRISTSDGKTLEAEIAGGSLISTDGTPLPAVGGKFYAVVRTVN
jgi:hypothetical protein